MKKLSIGLTALLPVILTGCAPIEAKAASMSLIYIAAAILSLLLLIGWCWIGAKQDNWFLLLFSSVLIVNVGYYFLSIAKTLELALWCNRISYLGSVFLPLAMLMIILNVTKYHLPKWLSYLLLGVAVIMFGIAGSPGYLNIYYADVQLQIIDGVSSLKKVYGPAHFLYLVYLLGYFTVMTVVIIRAAIRKRLSSPAHAVVLLTAVFVNLCVWLIEQLVEIDFEFLSVSYVITELFLLGLHMILQETEKLRKELSENTPPTPPPPAIDPLPVKQEDYAVQQERFLAGISELTTTERAVYDAYISGKTTKEIMAELNIKENTLKFHNKNLYSKLGVSSRKQLLEIYRTIKATNTP